VVDEAAVKKFSVRDVIGRVSGGVGAMRRPISVLSNLNTWRTSHCGLPPGDRVADRNGCKRATRVVVGAGQPLRRAQGPHLGLQGVRRIFLVPASWPKGALQQRMVPAVARFAF
jgi:hypothetical protein